MIQRLAPDALEQQIDALVQHLLGYPAIVSVRWNHGYDTEGDSALFFRVVVSNFAARRERLPIVFTPCAG